MKLTYEEGWYPEESAYGESFRWMRREAEIRVDEDLILPGSHLRIEAGHSFPDRPYPVLTVFADDERIGETEVESSVRSYAFAVERAGTRTFRFVLDSVFHFPSDIRELGILVYSIELVGPGAEERFLDGWYAPEKTKIFGEKTTVRWMTRKASSRLKGVENPGPRFVSIRAGHSYPQMKNPRLELRAGGQTLGVKTVSSGMQTYIFQWNEPEPYPVFEWELDRFFPPGQTGDSRRLGIQVEHVDWLDTSLEELTYSEGWQEWERGEFFPFRWMGKEAVLFLSPQLMKSARYVSFYAFSEFGDMSQTLSLEIDGEETAKTALLNKWNHYCLLLSVSGGGSPDRKEITEVRFVLNKLLPPSHHQTDMRELGIRVGEFRFHSDETERRHFEAFHSNARLNYEEMMDGKTDLASYPTNLGIDLYARCNINPPCVYCLWHSMKELEGEAVNAVVDEGTLLEYGPFFESARTLVNCSFGEPLLHPRFKEILDLCARHHKMIEISTNGQAFTDRTIQALVGRPVFLYVSLDAASRETYAKIRNDRWDGTVSNLVRLNGERKKANGLPKIFLVFMPMRVNLEDMEEYFRLAKRIDADSLVLRPLLYLENPEIRQERGGYVFNYADEMLPDEEIKQVIRRARGYSKTYGVPLANQFDFGKKTQAKEEDIG